MNTLEKLFAHRKRWNIEVDDQTAFQNFKNRALILLKIVMPSWSEYFWDTFALHFNITVGFEALDDSYSRNYSEELLNLLESSDKTEATIHYIQIFFITIEHMKSTADEDELDALEQISNSMFDIVRNALEFTPEMGIEVIKSNNQVTLYPKGTKLLDEAVINQNLLWLESHPAALRHLEQALTQYMTGDKKQQRNLLDNLRFALEQLLKDILRNKKSLENQQEELLRWLKEKKVHQQTINMYKGLLFGPYKQFQNDAVKHEEEFAENDIEFMIYLTGTFMRLLLQLEQKAPNPEN